MFKNMRDGLSLRAIHIWLIITMVVMSGTVVVATFRLTNTFLRLADAAMYESKKRGKHTYTFYAEEG